MVLTTVIGSSSRLRQRNLVTTGNLVLIGHLTFVGACVSMTLLPIASIVAIYPKHISHVTCRWRALPFIHRINYGTVLEVILLKENPEVQYSYILSCAVVYLCPKLLMDPMRVHDFRVVRYLIWTFSINCSTTVSLGVLISTWRDHEPHSFEVRLGRPPRVLGKMFKLSYIWGKGGTWAR